MSIVPAGSDPAALAALSQGISGTVSNNVATEAAFTPRLQLLHPQSKVRVDWDKEQGPKPEEGNFWVGPPGGFFLGKSFRCIPLAWRDHALQTEGDTVTLESFNAPAFGSLPKTPEEETFAKIRSAAAKKDSKSKIQNRIGKDILLWIPKQTQADPRWPGLPAGKFVIYFLAGTAVPEAENFRAFFFKATSVRAKEVNGRSFTWYVPEVALEGDGSLEAEEAPDMSACKEEMQKFANPLAKGKDTPAPEGAAGVDGHSR